MEKIVLLNCFCGSESVQNFNQQIGDDFAKNIETLEKELLQVTDALIQNGNLLKNAEA